MTPSFFILILLDISFLYPTHLSKPTITCKHRCFLLDILNLFQLLLANFFSSWIDFLVFFPWFLIFLDIPACYPAFLTNSGFYADDAPGLLVFSESFQMFLSIFILKKIIYSVPGFMKDFHVTHKADFCKYVHWEISRRVCWFHCPTFVPFSYVWKSGRIHEKFLQLICKKRVTTECRKK